MNPRELYWLSGLAVVLAIACIADGLFSVGDNTVLGQVERLFPELDADTIDSFTITRDETVVAAKKISGQEFGPLHDSKVRVIQKHAIYASMVEAMDDAVGKVLKALDDAGVSNNTFVVFTSDNGGLSTSEGSPTSNFPLKGGKGWVYEGGIREPWIIRYPGVTPMGLSLIHI